MHTLRNLAVRVAIAATIYLPLVLCASREHEYHLRLAATHVLRREGAIIGVPKNPRSESWLLGAEPYRALGDNDIRGNHELRQDELIKLVRVGPAISKQAQSALRSFRSLEVFDLDKRLLNPHARADGAGNCIAEILGAIATLPSVQIVDLSGSAVTDEDLLQLGPLRSLDALFLVRTDISGATFGSLSASRKLTTLDASNSAFNDEGARRLATCSSLTDLNLSGTKVTDVGLRFIGQLAKVKELSISETRISDEGMPNIASLRSLRRLYLGATRISGLGLSYLANLHELQDLSLYENDIDDESLQYLARLPKLKWLELSGTRVTGHGLKSLRALESLQQLVLRECPLSDDALFHVSQIKSLKAVYLENTSVTAKGIGRLKAIRPLLKVNWNGALPLKSAISKNLKRRPKPEEIGTWRRLLAGICVGTRLAATAAWAGARARPGRGAPFGLRQFSNGLRSAATAVCSGGERGRRAHLASRRREAPGASLFIADAAKRVGTPALPGD